MTWRELFCHRSREPSWQALASASLDRYSQIAFDRALLEAAGNTALLMVTVPTVIVMARGGERERGLLAGS